MRTPVPIDVRFWRLAEIVGGCWPWRGTINANGYGQFRIGRRGPVLSAHRVSWELHNGPIPSGKIIMHSCDHPWCVNPDHLSVGTQKDNMADCAAKGRIAKHRRPQRPHTRVYKLTDDQVREIRSDDRKVHIIAHEHQVSESCIYSIRSGERKRLVK